MPVKYRRLRKSNHYGFTRSSACGSLGAVPVRLKSKDDIHKMRQVGLIVADVLDAVEEGCRPGVSTWQLNEIAHDVMTRAEATSAFLGYAPGGVPPYPAVLCASINNVIVHGIPNKKDILQEGDIIGVDFACYKYGFCADSARTVAVGAVSEEARKLVDVARDALNRAIDSCHRGKRIQDIGWAVQSYVEDRDYSVVRDFVGHGIGRRMHEDPPVPNYGTPGRGRRLKPGLVIAIEPMVNIGEAKVRILSDGWTVVTEDGSLSAHFEHSVAITQEGPIVLTMR